MYGNGFWGNSFKKDEGKKRRCASMGGKCTGEWERRGRAEDASGRVGVENFAIGTDY